MLPEVLGCPGILGTVREEPVVLELSFACDFSAHRSVWEELIGTGEDTDASIDVTVVSLASETDHEGAPVIGFAIHVAVFLELLF